MCPALGLQETLVCFGNYKANFDFFFKSLTKFFEPSLEPSWCEVDGYLDRARECTLEVQSVPIVTNSVTLDFYSAGALILPSLNRYCLLDFTFNSFDSYV